MKIEPKMSGWAITDYSIRTKELPFTKRPFMYLEECLKLKRQESMDFILKNFRFFNAEEDGWVAWADMDTFCKIAILEYHPDYEAELIAYFGENWLDHYLRFNH